MLYLVGCVRESVWRTDADASSSTQVLQVCQIYSHFVSGQRRKLTSINVKTADDFAECHHSEPASASFDEQVVA